MFNFKNISIFFLFSPYPLPIDSNVRLFTSDMVMNVSEKKMLCIDHVSVLMKLFIKAL